MKILLTVFIMLIAVINVSVVAQPELYFETSHGADPGIVMVDLYLDTDGQDMSGLKATVSASAELALEVEDIAIDTDTWNFISGVTEWAADEIVLNTSCFPAIQNGERILVATFTFSDVDPGQYIIELLNPGGLTNSATVLMDSSISPQQPVVTQGSITITDGNSGLEDWQLLE